LGARLVRPDVSSLKMDVIPMRFHMSNIERLDTGRPWQISSVTNGLA